MANINGPSAAARPASARIDDCAERLTIASGYASNIFIGDPVMQTGTGNNIQSRCRHGGNADRQWLWRFRGVLLHGRHRQAHLLEVLAVRHRRR
ncbi:MAG: hypothetical protein IPK63_17975 [Candidatus Competibacteraceae bacterium]|nr:hypothetical protein [Candidatus Competibacteraceae bacterium]